MSLWQWAILICLPVLTLDHVGMTIWQIMRHRGDKEWERMEKRDKEWQEIFTAIDKSFCVTAKRLLDTWGAMQRLHAKIDDAEIEAENE